MKTIVKIGITILVPWVILSILLCLSMLFFDAPEWLSQIFVIDVVAILIAACLIGIVGVVGGLYLAIVSIIDLWKE